MTGTKLQDLSVAEAKLKELQTWKNYEVYEEIPNEGQRIIFCRWVCTEKPTVNGTVFKEENCVLRKDSPTCSKESLCLIFTIISSNHLEVNSLDIQSAFLQGKSITRDVHLMPPKEAGTEMLWKLKKCVYRLTDVFMMKLYFTGTLGMFCMVSFVHMWMISSGEDLPDSKVLSLID